MQWFGSILEGVLLRQTVHHLMRVQTLESEFTLFESLALSLTQRLESNLTIMFSSL